MWETGNERSFCQNLENIFIFKIFLAQGHFLNVYNPFYILWNPYLLKGWLARRGSTNILKGMPALPAYI